MIPIKPRKLKFEKGDVAYCDVTNELVIITNPFVISCDLIAGIYEINRETHYHPDVLTLISKGDFKNQLAT